VLELELLGLLLGQLRGEVLPVLADRVAVNWGLGADEVVRRLRKAID